MTDDNLPPDIGLAPGSILAIGAILLMAILCGGGGILWLTGEDDQAGDSR